MADKAVIFGHIAAQYPRQVPNAFTKLYADQDPTLREAFADLHERLNALLRFLNTKIGINGHFNADPSREFLDLIEEIRDLRTTLDRVGVEVTVRDDYQQILDDCAAFLVPSGGSPIPNDFKKVTIERFEAVFLTGVSLPSGVGDERERPTLIVVGEGSFANVHKYVDPVYGITIAQKTAKRNISSRDRERFRAEFNTMKGLSFPNVVQVYAYSESADSYTMEFCDTTLQNYIQRNNASLSWTARKRIALQFLYGINYLHKKGILHRDVSLNNVLIRIYDEGAVQVKLSDFGLHKAPDSDFTKVDTAMKGSITDPTLASFKEFAVVNDIYAVGHVLSFIFSGRAALGSGVTGATQAVVERCTDNNPAQRFQAVREVIAAVEVLADPKSAGSESVGAPA